MTQHTTPKIKYKQVNYRATLNVQSLIKLGKLKTITDFLGNRNIMITGLQETRYVDNEPFESNGYRIYQSKSNSKILKGIPVFGTGFIVSNKIIDSVLNFDPIDERTASLTFKSTNKIYKL